MSKKSFQIYLSLAILFSTQIAFAHGAHEHGSAKIDIGVENTTATIHLEVPAISVYGFEHEPKNDKDKKAVKSAVEKMETNINQMVKLDSSLGCSFSVTKIDPFVKDNDDEGEGEEKNTKNDKNKKESGEHGDFHADFTASCKKKISGSKVTFGFQKYFPNMRKISVQGLSDTSQAAAKISDDKGFLQL
jgi:Protein of unknown function (DUF2796)